jgi:prophage regulatory protein
MSSVHAVTEDIVFTVKVASFYPIKTDVLVKEFGEWLAQKGKEQNFIVWRVAIEGASKGGASKGGETAIGSTQKPKTARSKSDKKQKTKSSVAVNGLSRIVRIPELSARLGLSVSSIYLLIAKGTLPKPKTILSGGRAVGWDSEVIEAWFSAKDGASKEST